MIMAVFAHVRSLAGASVTVIRSGAAVARDVRRGELVVATRRTATGSEAAWTGRSAAGSIGAREASGSDISEATADTGVNALT